MAYEKDPKTPAPPVPEDQVDTTFLSFWIESGKNNLKLDIHMEIL